MRARTQSKRAGFTLLEVLIAVGLLTFIVASFAEMTLRGFQTAQASVTSTEVDAKLRRALAQIVREMGACAEVTFDPDPSTAFGSERLEFRASQGMVGGVPVLGPRTHIGFEYAPGEVDNDLDDDGDGLVDEGVVVLTRGFGTPDALRVRLLSQVREMMPGEILNGVDDNGNGVADEMGLSFHLDGNALTLRLALEMQRGGQARITRTAETTILVRN